MTFLPRHLAPVATPLPLASLLGGLGAPAQTTEQFGAALARYLATPATFLASSGRTAFYLLLKSLQAQQPDRHSVVLPAYTCPALAKVVLDAGLQPSLVDIVPATFAYHLDELATYLNEQTLTVVLVHPFGMPQTVAPVQALAHGVGAVLIEDAAQSLGASLDGRPVGTHGDYGLFSLGPGKPLSTGGGGFVCARDAEQTRHLAAAWQILPPVRPGAASLALTRLALFTLAFQPPAWWLATRAGAQRVGEQEASWGFALTDLTRAQAAVGLAQLPHLDDYNRQRQVRATQIIERLQALDFVQLPCPVPSAMPIYLRLPVLVATEALREQLFQRLWAAGIGVGRMYGRTLAEFFPTLNLAPYPGAQQIARRLLTLPTHHFVRPHDIDRIGEIFAQGER